MGVLLNLIFRKYNPQERAQLVETAMGRTPADLIITNVNILDVNRGIVLDNHAVLIKQHRVAGIIKNSDIDRFKGKDTILLTMNNQYAIPGFIDLHIHIESSMLDPVGFSKIALRHGTTTIVADPHEIVNVLGLEGFKIFSEVSRNLPLKILLEIPSCVPPTDPEMGLESAPNLITSSDVKKAVSIENVIGLGEVMDFISVLNASRETLAKIESSYNAGLIVDGHAPLLTSHELNAYIAAGILSDHESTDIDEASEKASRGMYVYIRQGSAWQDLPALIEMIKHSDCKLCAFVSDDVNVLDLIKRGHMDRIINTAIEYGLDPIKAIQYATINPALRLHLEDHIGIIAPGRLGDIVITNRIERIEPRTVLANGEIIYYEGKLVKPIEPAKYPDFAVNTVRLDHNVINNLDIIPLINTHKPLVKVNVIEVKPGSTLTKHVVEDLRVSNGRILPDPARDIMYVGVIERHKGTGSHSVGFIKGLSFKAGAIAQTIAHDTHNLIYAGWSENDIRLAIDRLLEIQGGIVVVHDGKIISEIPLRLAGLMSLEEPEVVYERYIDMTAKLGKLGVEFEAFFMTLSLVSLPVIPELRLTDKGLVNVKEGRLIPLVVD